MGFMERTQAKPMHDDDDDDDHDGNDNTGVDVAF